MTRQAAIVVEGAGKRFTKYVDTPMLLSSALRIRPHTRRERLWAVRGVDFTVADGESVGVIGRNGSGKTTLMSMMAGITAPTEGSVRVWGRVAPLIAVGVGFHRELTGRENIYVNGAILGLTRRQIDQRLEEIIAFSEVGDFIDTPVKFYSSGMYVRLGFAVAAHADPDVLIVDEVLAVGDFSFQMKCFERMNQIRERGTTVVMVSHHLGVIRRMCERVLLMHQGQPRYLGPPEEAISAFHEVLHTATDLQVDDATGLRFEPQVLTIDEVTVAGDDGAPRRHLDASETLTVRVRGQAQVALDDLVVAMTVHGNDGTLLYADSTAGRPFGAVAAGQSFSCAMSMRARLPTGSYRVGVRIDRPDLRTTLAQHPATPFFVTGRHTVVGLADLEGTFVREDPAGDRTVAAPNAASAVP